MKEDSTIKELYNEPRSPFTKLSWLLCHKTTKLDLKKEQAKMKLMKQLNSVYEKGAITHATLTPDTGEPTTNEAL